MKVVLAPDSFKGSISARDLCAFLREGVLEVFPEAQVTELPLADGGEGTTEALAHATGGRMVECEALDPLGRPVRAAYGALGDGRTAVVEMAQASGLPLLAPHERNPLIADSFGTGQLIREALRAGYRRLIIGLGGSATNDGGAGMAEALGARFLDAAGRPLARGGGRLGDLARIDVSALDPRLQQAHLIVACDVDNPLCGDRGASRVFGPQKGATAAMAEQLDAALAHYAEVARRQLGRDVRDVPGAGAAGGLGAGLLLFTQAEMRRGVEIVLDFTGLREKVAAADVVFTGEGGIDFQTKFGKVPYGVARIAKAAGKRVIAIAGTIGEGADALYAEGIDAIFGITPGAAALSQLLAAGPRNVQRTCENIGRLLRLS